MSNLNEVKTVLETIKIEKIYVKEIHFKLPHAPNLFENPKFQEPESKIEPNMEINVKTQGISLNKFEVTLNVIINGKIDNFSLFNLEIQQAGIFNINVPHNQLEDIVKNYCVPILHPYLSHVTSNSMIQAGLPPMMLQPFQPVLDKAHLKLNNVDNSKLNVLNNIASKEINDI